MKFFHNILVLLNLRNRRFSENPQKQKGKAIVHNAGKHSTIEIRPEWFPSSSDIMKHKSCYSIFTLIIKSRFHCVQLIAHLRFKLSYYLNKIH